MPDLPRRDRASRFLPLSVQVFHILLAVSDRDLHGYAIIQDIRDRTAGEVDLTASTLYAAIKRLLEAGLLVELEARPGPEEDARRRYYRLTPFGREVARLEAARLERALRAARDKHIVPGRV